MTQHLPFPPSLSPFFRSSKNSHPFLGRSFLVFSLQGIISPPFPFLPLFPFLGNHGLARSVFFLRFLFEVSSTNPCLFLTRCLWFDLMFPLLRVSSSALDWIFFQSTKACPLFHPLRSLTLDFLLLLSNLSDLYFASVVRTSCPPRLSEGFLLLSLAARIPGALVAGLLFLSFFPPICMSSTFFSLRFVDLLFSVLHGQTGTLSPFSPSR